MSNSRDSLRMKTLAELRQMCNARSITGMSKANKDRLIDALIRYEETHPDVTLLQPTIGGTMAGHAHNSNNVSVSSGANNGRYRESGTCHAERR